MKLSEFIAALQEDLLDNGDCDVYIDDQDWGPSQAPTLLRAKVVPVRSSEYSAMTVSDREAMEGAQLPLQEHSKNINDIWDELDPNLQEAWGGKESFVTNMMIGHNHRVQTLAAYDAADFSVIIR